MATTGKIGEAPAKKRAEPAAGKAAAKPATKPASGKVKPTAGKVKPTAGKVKPTAGKGKLTATKPAGKAAKRARAPVALAPEQRRHHVEITAYHIAERRGFHGNHEMDDWVQAEAEVDSLVRAGVLKP